MVHTDLKFFTNEPERDLYSRFSAILKSNTQLFDVLVGYFRTSGFFRIYKALEPVEKIRILVGLNVDAFTVRIIDQAKGEVKLASVSSREGKERISNKIQAEFESVTATEQVEEGVRIFIEWLRSGKLEMRMYTESPIHAKVYIMRKDPDKVPDTFGSVITGSSNFSEAGLVNNLEFNVELKDRPDVEFALERFEELWKKAVDIRDTYIEAVEQDTWLRNDITPYEMYLKTLYEFFKEQINADKDLGEVVLPEGYMRLQYQIDAVMQAKQKLDAYGGVFISDVVGLGKTYICAMLANTFPRSAWKLVVCPPVLVEYWEGVLKEFDVSRVDVVSLGKLDQLISHGTDKYAYVFVDEAHRFRNAGTEAFTQLHQICHGKKVVLVSATPINNYTTDIENQLYLFQSKQSGTINGIRNLDGFFRMLDSNMKGLKKGTPEYMQRMRSNSEIIRDRLLREVMIRRTRSEIQQYYADDLARQGLTFPKVGSPERILYEFDDQTDAIFTETIAIIRRFKYARYQPLIYLKDTKKYATLIAGQRNMGGFMKGVLVKRLESSFHAFRMTLNRFIESYEKFIRMVESGTVYISKRHDEYELREDGRLDKLMQLVEEGEAWKLDAADFSLQFMKDLKSDLTQLRMMKANWSLVGTDPKLEEFRGCLTTNPAMKGKKVIVFTESTETAQYLAEKLADLYGARVVCYSGQSSAGLKSDIEDSFNPKFASRGNDKFDLLITTDVLSEGINLHRANVLVNYDLPWNPTRIMQRVGRVNRVGTDYDRIYVFNFFPTAQSHRQLPMEDRILEKLQAFHDTLGEDAKYLTDEEDVSPKKLFEDMSQSLDGEEEGGSNPEMVYLLLIRGIRDNDPKLFERIRRMPRKTKACKASSRVSSNASITFMRRGALKAFFLTEGSQTRPLTFMEAVQYMAAEPDEKPIAVHADYYSQLRTNEEAFDTFLREEEAVKVERAMVTGNDAKVIRLLKAIRQLPTITDNDELFIDTLISRYESGEIPPKLSKDILKISTDDPLILLAEIKKMVPETYMEDRTTKQSGEGSEKQVILTCCLKNGGKA